MKKILISDEVMMIIANEKSFLGRNDIELFMAPTSDDMLDIHRAERADIIISTLHTSGMMCEDLCSAIRADEALRKVSIILICSNNAVDIERSSQCKANVSMTLPVAPHSFSRKCSSSWIFPRGSRTVFSSGCLSKGPVRINRSLAVREISAQQVCLSKQKKPSKKGTTWHVLSFFPVRRR